MIKNRTIEYEIWLYLENRWVIDIAIEDEIEAIKVAQSHLRQKRCSEVKIVRCRSSDTGLRTEKTVFEEKVQATEVIKIRSGGKNSVFCHVLQEFYDYPARYEITRVFGEYLNKNQITATELLHVYPFQKRISESTSMIGAAINQVARIQSEMTGISVKDRSNELQRLVDRLMRQARDTHSEKKFAPKLNVENLNRTWVLVGSHYSEDKRAHVMSFLLADYIGSKAGNNLSSKMDIALSLMQSGEDDLRPEVFAILEGIIADCLMSPDTIRDLFGKQANGGVYALELTKFVARMELNATSLSNPLMRRLLAQLAETPMLQIDMIMLDWLARQLSSGKGFNLEMEKETEILKDIEGILKTDDGRVLGGNSMAEAISLCKLAQRQRVLRSMGMHDTADNLAKTWKTQQGQGSTGTAGR